MITKALELCKTLVPRIYIRLLLLTCMSCVLFRLGSQTEHLMASIESRLVTLAATTTQVHEAAIILQCGAYAVSGCHVCWQLSGKSCLMKGLRDVEERGGPEIGGVWVTVCILQAAKNIWHGQHCCHESPVCIHDGGLRISETI